MRIPGAMHGEMPWGHGGDGPRTLRRGCRRRVPHGAMMMLAMASRTGRRRTALLYSSVTLGTAVALARVAMEACVPSVAALFRGMPVSNDGRRRMPKDGQMPMALTCRDNA